MNSNWLSEIEAPLLLTCRPKSHACSQIRNSNCFEPYPPSSPLIETCHNLPLDNLQSSLAVKTPEALTTSLQMTSLNGFLGYPGKQSKK